MRSRSPQPRCYTAMTVMLPAPLLSPATWDSHALGCALGSPQGPCSHHCVNTSGTGLNKRELLCPPLSGTPAKTCPAQPPSRRTQTHGPTSCQAYREEMPEQPVYLFTHSNHIFLLGHFQRAWIDFAPTEMPPQAFSCCSLFF